MINGSFTVVKQGLVLGGYIPTHCTGAISFSSATPNVEFILRDYSGGGRGNSPDVKFWGGNRVTLYNSKSGTVEFHVLYKKVQPCLNLSEPLLNPHKTQTFRIATK
jgi:hypothetical protein